MTHKFRKETVSPQTFLCANYGLTFYLSTLFSLNSSFIPSNHLFLPVQPSNLLGVEQRTYFILHSRSFSEEMSSRSAASISFDDPLGKVKRFVIEKGLMVRFLSFALKELLHYILQLSKCIPARNGPVLVRSTEVAVSLIPEKIFST